MHPPVVAEEVEEDDVGHGAGRERRNGHDVPPLQGERTAARNASNENKIRVHAL